MATGRLNVVIEGGFGVAAAPTISDGQRFLAARLPHATTVMEAPHVAALFGIIVLAELGEPCRPADCHLAQHERSEQPASHRALRSVLRSVQFG